MLDADVCREFFFKRGDFGSENEPAALQHARGRGVNFGLDGGVLLGEVEEGNHRDVTSGMGQVTREVTGDKGQETRKVSSGKGQVTREVTRDKRSAMVQGNPFNFFLFLPHVTRHFFHFLVTRRLAPGLSFPEC